MISCPFCGRLVSGNRFTETLLRYIVSTGIVNEDTFYFLKMVFSKIYAAYFFKLAQQLTRCSCVIMRLFGVVGSFVASEIN